MLKIAFVRVLSINFRPKKFRKTDAYRIRLDMRTTKIGSQDLMFDSFGDFFLVLIFRI